MKKLFPAYLIFLIVFSISCKTQKEVQSSDPPSQSSSQTVRLPQIEPQEKPLSPEEINDIRSFAEQVAELFCSYQKADKKYKESGNFKDLSYSEELENALHKHQSKAKDYYPTERKKQEYDRIYNELINQCE